MQPPHQLLPERRKECSDPWEQIAEAKPARPPTTQFGGVLNLTAHSFGWWLTGRISATDKRIGATSARVQDAGERAENRAPASQQD
jgi:hypothetical protein